MNGRGKINLFFSAWGGCLRSMRVIKTFSPFLLYAGLQGVILAILVFFAYPPFSSVLVPLIKKLFGEAALHYPNNFIVLSPLFNQANFILSGIIGIIVIGMATQMFASLYRDQNPSFKNGLQVTLPKYGLLFVVWIVESALILCMVAGLPLLLNKMIHPAYRLMRIIQLGSLLLGILVGAMFAYTSALIILDQRGISKAISGSLSIFSGNALISFFLIAIPSLFHFPINFLSRKAPLLVTKFAPEVMIVILAVGIVIAIFANYILVGTVTRFYLAVTGRVT